MVWMFKQGEGACVRLFKLFVVVSECRIFVVLCEAALVSLLECDVLRTLGSKRSLDGIR